MRRHRNRLLFALVLAACATGGAIAYPSPGAAPVAALRATACEAPADTSRIYLSWDPVLDRRGAAVAHYVWALVVNGAPGPTGQTSQTQAVHAMPCPQYGDSIAVRGTVYAVDSRGTAGVTGTSATIVLRTPDPGPPAPVIRIDTIPSAPGGEEADSLTLTFVDDPLSPGVVARWIVAGGGPLPLYVGEHVQACPLWWYGGRAYLDQEYVTLCQGGSGIREAVPASLLRLRGLAVVDAPARPAD